VPARYDELAPCCSANSAPSIAQSCNHVKPSWDPPASIPQPLHLYANMTQRFRGVRDEGSELQIGGYQVLHRWLKDRKGRSLSYDDVTHYGKIVVALKETIRLMGEIDQVIPSWPME